LGYEGAVSSPSRALVVGIGDIHGRFHRVQEWLAALEQALGREIGATGLYLAHFLGPAGATEFLRAADHDGSTPAANVLPAAAAANRSVFYDGAGEPRTVAEIYRRFSEKFAAADSPAADASPSITAATAPRDVGRASPRATFAPLLTGPLLATLDAIAFSALRLLGGERETRTDESHRAS
jgi:hypothetical protein